MYNMIRFLCTLKNEEQKENSDWKNIQRHDFKWIKDVGWLPK